MTRFAIEATCLADARPTGIGRYAQGLIAGFAELHSAADDYDITVLYRTSRRRRRQQIVTAPGVRRQAWRGQHWPLLKSYALVHSVFDRMPPWPQPLKLTTVHDVYAAVGINADDAAEREGMLAMYHRAARESDALLFDSSHSRDDFLRLIGFDASRCTVIPLGVEARFRPRPADELAAVRSRYGLHAPYLLFVGLTNPNKNLPRLLEALAHSTVPPECELALVGEVPDAQRASIRERIGALGLDGRVRFAGYVDDADLPALYAAAEAFLFPSLYEGFGLPILEAMASGVPVLTSTTSACPETAQDHAVLVDPQSIEQIAAGISAALALTPAAREAARVYAAGCTWKRTAERTLAAYRAALERGRR